MRSTPPPALEVLPETIPAELKAGSRFVLWRWVQREGKWTKPPYMIDASLAAVDDPTTWTTFTTALDTCRNGHGFAGLGRVLLPEDGLAGIDLDKCRDPETGAVEPWAMAIVQRITSYTEISPSGTGLRILLRGALPPGRRRRDQIEMYDRGRYLTLTGHHLAGTPTTVEERTAELAAFHAETFGSGLVIRTETDDELIARAAAAKNGAKFRALWAGDTAAYRGNWSDADFALINILAFWTGGDRTHIDRLFRRSGLMRDKWDEARGDTTYGWWSIDRALEDFQPRGPKLPPSYHDGTSDGATEDRGATPTVTVAGFLAIPSQDRYVYRPTREFWTGEAVNRLLPTARAEPSTAAWLTQHQRAEQVTWMPGEPEIIENRYLVGGAWQPHAGARAYNLYQPPRWHRRNEQRAIRARPWWRLLSLLYPEEWGQIVAWLAWRVQRPAVKINHALVLGGDQGIGKDTILDPLRTACGPANCVEVSPQMVMGQFNEYVRAVILRISEIRDLGDVNRYSFYEHTKTLIASPPEVLTVNQKYLTPYGVPNLVGLIFTTNHRQGGLYLPADDRRHFVCWSEVRREDFPATYFTRLYQWLDAGGREEVTADLAAIDLDRLGFDPKAPPPQTPAFHTMVDAGHAPETLELADLLEALGTPPAVTLTQISAHAQTLQRYSLVNWLTDRKNLRQIPHRLAEAGYVPVRNPVETRGRWTIAGQKQTVYAQRVLAPGSRMAVAAALR